MTTTREQAVWRETLNHEQAMERKNKELYQNQEFWETQASAVGKSGNFKNKHKEKKILLSVAQNQLKGPKKSGFYRNETILD